MQRFVPALCLAVLLIGAAVPPGAAGQDRLPAPIPRDRGQSVTASFEGWYPEADGSRVLVFGYFNRNYEERLDIPVGPDNRFDPGPADRGQPTHFLPRRQTGVFGVRVPADFGDRRLTWILRAHGAEIAIPGHLDAGWEITALDEVTSGNTPPVLRLGGPDGEPGQGPFGVHGVPTTAAVGAPTPVVVWAADDGVRKARAAERPPRFGLLWSKYRGPGEVTFAERDPAVGSDGRAETAATFSAPGDYVLRVLAWDDSGGQAAVMAGGFFCCWTNAFLPVQVR